MKKLLIILLGTFAFACGDAATTTGDNATMGEGVEIGAGETISPQLEPASGSIRDFNIDDSISRFDVDTVSSAKEIHERENH